VRKSVLEDPSLDVWAFRLLLYMVTKPEGFVFVPAVLMRDGSLPPGPRGGRSWVVEKALPALHEAGFIKPAQGRRVNGTFGRGGTWELVRDRVIVPVERRIPVLVKLDQLNGQPRVSAGRSRYGAYRPTG
jgi:hypothetical protein